ncbi:outer membrane beta-barrel protein [Helicobacter salomonis]|uniref:OMP1116 n=1 Tax=Helicobacter salomonis TaxID=56878 RepID=A0A1M4NIF1_9HELI|nr:outer membrane beta-barrel protein [Helicobacter salomonis]SFZ73035.1 OMP1116 [Helicobacter salomonis]SFZ73081.1 OMP92 [Helicobacter salomonis]
MRFQIIVLLGLVQGLWAVKNHIFTGARLGSAKGFSSSFSEQTSMSNPSVNPNGKPVCPQNLCKGNLITGYYNVDKQANFAFTYTVGDEIFFDKFAVSGMRVYGTLEYINAYLGALNKTMNQGGKNYSPQYLKAIDPATGDVIPQTIVNGKLPDGFKNVGGDLAVPSGYSSPCAPLSAQNPLGICPTPNPQKRLLQQGAHVLSFGLNVDVFLNIPLDIWIKKIYSKMFFFKVGMFVGGGVEYTMFWSDRFFNQALGKKTRFLAAGSGFFVNVGTQVYMGQHNRIIVGWKIPYYKLSAQNWYNYGNSNVGTQQTLKQSLSLVPHGQFYVGYAYLF